MWTRSGACARSASATGPSGTSSPAASSSVWAMPRSARRFLTRVAVSRSVSTTSTAKGSLQSSRPAGYGRTGSFAPSPFSASRISQEMNGMKGWRSASESRRTRRRTDARLRLLGLGDVRVAQDLLDHLDVAVAELGPEEGVEGVRRLVEAEDLERLVHLRRRGREPVEDPAVDACRGRRSRELSATALLAEHPHREAGGVPDLRREGAGGRDARRPERQVAPRPREDGEGEADRVGAVLVAHDERVDDVPLRLRHLLSPLVADEAVEEDLAEGDAPVEPDARHDHPGDPEEEDVEARDHDVGRVEAREVLRLVRPAEDRERHEPRGEPGVEDVGVARQRRAAAACRTPTGRPPRPASAP